MFGADAAGELRFIAFWAVLIYFNDQECFVNNFYNS